MVSKSSRAPYSTYDIVAHHVWKNGNGARLAMKSLQSTETPTSITSVHKETDPIVNQLWKKHGAVVHAIALRHERLIGLHIARFKRPRRVCTKRSLVLGVVHPYFNPT